MIRPKIESLQFNNLSFATTDGKTILKDVDFQFPKNGLFWLRSESGAGKSTVLRLLDGLVEPSSGQYFVNGQDVNEMSFVEFTPYRLQFGLSFDFGGLINNRTLQQNLSLMLEYHKFYEDREVQCKVLQWLEKFGVKDVADVRPSSVPGAVRKVICVLRAFVHNPQVMLLDDPTTGLRKEARRALIEAIGDARMTKDRLIIVATEDLDLIKDINIDGHLTIHDQKIAIETEKLRRHIA